MFRPAIGPLIVAMALAIAGQAAAELPMSPIYRTDQVTAAGQSRQHPAEHANPVSPGGQGTAAPSAQAAAPKPEQHAPAPKADAKTTDSAKIVATALIPPPLPPAPPAPAAEPPTAPIPSMPAEHVAAPPRKTPHAPRPHYADYRYPYPFRYFSAGSASNPPHLGPNPYSPNGGD